MVFSSTVFLFLFLPIVLGVNFILKKSLRNSFILLSSLFFYAWGENILVLLMMGSICVNYVIGILISYAQKEPSKNLSTYVLTVGVILNLSVLIYYKYIQILMYRALTCPLVCPFLLFKISRI